MNFLRLQLDNAIANGRIAMRIERDERDWLKQAIEKGRRELRQSRNNEICPVCGKPVKFVEDNEDMGWYCESCHIAIEPSPQVCAELTRERRAA